MPAPVINSVVICNSALLKLGADTITSLAQTGRAATTCNTLYAYLRDEVTSAFPWRHAVKRAVLSPNGTTPPFDFQQTYDIPSDCLRMLRPDDDSITWKQEGTQILSDEVTLDMLYIFRNDDESSWSALFAETLAWRLCMELALSLTKSIPMAEKAEKSYKERLAEARAVDSAIGSGQQLEADIWSRSRRGFKLPKTVGQLT